MGRRSKVVSPTGLKGCPRCRQLFDLIEYGPGTYCRNCTPAYKRERYAIGQLVKSGNTEQEAVTAVKEHPNVIRQPTSVGLLRHVTLEEKVKQAQRKTFYPPFPKLALAVVQGCRCCSSHKGLTQVGDARFCERCAYYVTQCGRCLAHARREYIPVLLKNPDPPLLVGDLGYNSNTSDEDDDTPKPHRVDSRWS